MDELRSGIQWLEANPGIAGWIQGFAAIAALGLAVFMPQIHEKAREKATLIRRLDALGALATYASELVVTAAEQLNDRKYAMGYVMEAYKQRAFDHAIQALEAVPLHELHSKGLVENLIALRSALVEGAASTKCAVSNFGDDAIDWDGIVENLPDVAKRAQNAALGICNARRLLT